MQQDAAGALDAEAHTMSCADAFREHSHWLINVTPASLHLLLSKRER